MSTTYVLLEYPDGRPVCDDVSGWPLLFETYDFARTWARLYLPTETVSVRPLVRLDRTVVRRVRAVLRDAS